jgi:hypothetical protein
VLYDVKASEESKEREGYQLRKRMNKKERKGRKGGKGKKGGMGRKNNKRTKRKRFVFRKFGYGDWAPPHGRAKRTESCSVV